MRIINHYMRTHNVNFELQSRVRKSLQYSMKNEFSNSFQDNVILDKINLSLKKELVIESLGKLIKGIPFFKNNFSNSTNENLAFHLKKIQLSPGQYLYKVKFILGD